VAIEKHFSLDPSRPSFDHAISLDPRGFRQMVLGIREAETARGKIDHAFLPDVREKRRLASRYLGAIRPIAAGQFFTEANVGFLRLDDTKDALPAAAFSEILGARAVTDLALHTPLTAGCYCRD
jgi:sialic acid synthase SpsE